MQFRLTVATFAVVLLAYVSGPGPAMCLMVGLGALILLDSQKGAGEFRTDP